MRDRLEAANQEIAGLHQQVAMLKSESSCTAQAEDKVKESLEAIRKLEQEKRKDQAEAQRVAGELSAAVSQCQRLEAKLEAVTSDLTNSRNENKSLQEELMSMRLSLGQSSAESSVIPALKTENSQLKQEIVDLVVKQQKLVSQTEIALSSSKQEATEELKTLRDSHTIREESLQNDAQRITSDLREALHHEQVLRQHLEAELLEITQQLQVSASERDVARVRLRTCLEEEVQPLTQQVLELQMRATSESQIQEEIGTLKQKLEGISADELKRAMTERDEKHDMFVEASRKLHMVEREKSSLLAKMEELRAVHFSSNQEVEALQKQLMEQRGRASSSEAELQSELSRQTVQLASVQASLVRANEEVSECQIRIMERNAEGETSRSSPDNVSLRAQLDACNSELAELQQQMMNVQAHSQSGKHAEELTKLKIDYELMVVEKNAVYERCRQLEADVIDVQKLLIQSRDNTKQMRMNFQATPSPSEPGTPAPEFPQLGISPIWGATATAPPISASPASRVQLLRNALAQPSSSAHAWG